MGLFASPEDTQGPAAAVSDEADAGSSTTGPLRAGAVFDSLRNEILELSDDPVVAILASTLFGEGTKRWQAALTSISALLAEE